MLWRLADQMDIELVRIGSAGAKAMAVVSGDVDAYLHAGGQWEWDSAAPAGVVWAAGLHASRLDGSPLIYNRRDPYLPDLLMCRPSSPRLLLTAIRSVIRGGPQANHPRVEGMQSWQAPSVPALPGRGPQLRLYDTADRQVRPVSAGDTATMYVCGITPYDATHLGHAATYLTFDLVHRLWLDAGHQVHYVQNITDVDDPLFERAERDGIDWRELADRETELFREDMTALRVLPPHDYVAATEAIGEVIELVEKMLASGCGLRRRRRRAPRRLLPRRCHRAVRLRVGLRPRHHDAAVRRAWRRPRPRGQERRTRRAAVAGAAARRAQLAVAVRPGQARAGTWNARRSR